jgi:dihydrofolate reductase
MKKNPPRVRMKKNPPRVRMPSIASIVARSYPDRIIGIDNTLPWHLRTDLQLFKERTKGHAIIMGRKTFESIGKPLPGRTNIILARTKPAFIDDFPSLHWASNPETACLIADMYSICSGRNEFFVIGGEQIYDVFHKYLNRIFVTDVFCGNINGDAKFAVEFNEDRGEANSEWINKNETDYPKSEHDQYPFRVTEYKRRKPEHRWRVKADFMGRDASFERYWDEYETLHSETVLSKNKEEQLSIDL